MLKMLTTYVYLETCVKQFGQYPSYVTEDQARTNGWTCITGRSFFKYVLPGPGISPVLVDPNPHLSGYIVVYGDGKVAVIPEKDFGSFFAGLNGGQVSISASWKRQGERLRYGEYHWFRKYLNQLDKKSRSRSIGNCPLSHMEAGNWGAFK